MALQPENNPSGPNGQPIKNGKVDLSSLWVGGDKNVESVVMNGKDGKLENLWISALSEAGEERFVYCNQGNDGANTIPGAVAEQLSHVYAQIVKKNRTLSDALTDIGRIIGDAKGTGFWSPGVGEDMFVLPAGLKTKRQISLLPTFEAVCADPTLGRNLFAVGTDKLKAAVYIDETRNCSLIGFGTSVYRIPGEYLSNGSLRETTFAKVNLLVDSLYDEFSNSMARYKVHESWKGAGGPAANWVTKGCDGFDMTYF